MAERYVIGARKAAAHLRSVAANLLDLSRAFEDIGGFYRGQIRSQFTGRGFLIGVSGPWQPLAYETTFYKKEHKGQPLVYTGELMESWTNRSDPYNINDVQPQKAQFGTSNPLAHFHQFGTSQQHSSPEAVGRRHIPPRPVVLGNDVLDQYIVYSIGKQLFSGWV